MEGAATGLSSVIEVVGELFSQMGEVVSTMTAEGNGIMLIPIGIFVAGAVIGLASRILGR